MLSVVLGAFGAHGLEQQLPSNHLDWWQKAVDYQSLHSLSLLATGLLALRYPSKALGVAGWSFLLGMLLFSGSLYLLALTGIRTLAMLTPFGGLAFILGWCGLILAAWRLPRTET